MIGASDAPPPRAMSVRAQWLVVLGVVLLLGAVLAAGLRAFSGEPRVKLLAKAPDFRALTLDSVPRPRTLADYAGGVVLLNVWATWCTPCRTEMPSIEALHRTFGPRGLRVVAVSVDQVAGPKEIRAFADELGLTFDILRDSAQAIAKAYQLVGYPATYVIGKDGRIRKMQLGKSDWNSAGNRALVADLLGLTPEPQRTSSREGVR